MFLKMYYPDMFLKMCYPDKFTEIEHHLAMFVNHFDKLHSAWRESKEVAIARSCSPGNHFFFNNFR